MRRDTGYIEHYKHLEDMCH